MNILTKNNLRSYLFSKESFIVYIFPFLGGFLLRFFENKYSICLFMNITGLPCPFCGLSRAFASLTSFDLKNALKLNPFSFVFAAIFIFLIFIRFLPSKIKKRVYGALLKNLKKINASFIILFVFMIIFDILRIYDKFSGVFGFQDLTPEITILKIIKRF